MCIFTIDRAWSDSEQQWYSACPFSASELLAYRMEVPSPCIEEHVLLSSHPQQRFVILWQSRHVPFLCHSNDDSSDSDLAMDDLCSNQRPPQYSHSCTVPATKSALESPTLDILNSNAYHTKVPANFFNSMVWVLGLRIILENLGTNSGASSRAGLMLRRLRRTDAGCTVGRLGRADAGCMVLSLRRADTERMVV